MEIAICNQGGETLIDPFRPCHRRLGGTQRRTEPCRSSGKRNILGQLAFENDYLGNWLDIGRELLLDALEVVAVVVSDEIDRQTEVTVTS